MNGGDNKALVRKAIAALGIVFGDIGTSPLYTIRNTFGGTNLAISEANVFGVLSLVFWLLVLVVSVKYIVFIMRADNRGEGGILALMALAQRGVRGNNRMHHIVVVLGLLGASLFYGDGVITPAMSVLGAVEGIKVAAPSLGHFVVPVSVAILLTLFLIQNRGSGKVGSIFGPTMLLWFVTIAILGAKELIAMPHVLMALNPYYGVAFFLKNGLHGFLALGGVVLAITGGEALYADMGHFGKQPIRAAWFGLASFALVLNYFGQGALLLNNPEAIANPFYFLVPNALRIPMLVLATSAAIIASQAVISGAFSMTREAIQLGFAPRMEVKHTSRETRGDIYLPAVNRTLLVFVIAAVLGFRSSENLGTAYGIAVTGTMLITTLLALIVERRLWQWNRTLVIAVGLLFISIDLSLLGANAFKIAEGGWFPLVLGLGSFLILSTWRRGRELLLRELKQSGLALEPFIESVVAHPPPHVPGTAIFLTANPSNVPNALLHNLKHNKVLHERNILLTVESLDTPLAEHGERAEITALGHKFYRVVLRFGFSEEPNIPQALQNCRTKDLNFDMMDTTFFLSRETVVSARRHGMSLWRDKLFSFLARNASPATTFFCIPGNRMIVLGAQVEI
ncbi:potassium transporter Kup [Dyella sp. GSA-30]|uniref:potassium transporter Kup n=1 Tax=Dyella sp. GSA-30 TaxID=2994496 RepID=UPI00248F67FD|nr:potassium transporter Kup [Dyella sp. GSA-30]BDU21605.1 putative potassium transport system protein kup [Dyella sp. GSA-30]